MPIHKQNCIRQTAWLRADCPWRRDQSAQLNWTQLKSTQRVLKKFRISQLASTLWSSPLSAELSWVGRSDQSSQINSGHSDHCWTLSDRKRNGGLSGVPAADGAQVRRARPPGGRAAGVPDVRQGRQRHYQRRGAAERDDESRRETRRGRGRRDDARSRRRRRRRDKLWRWDCCRCARSRDQRSFLWRFVFETVPRRTVFEKTCETAKNVKGRAVFLKKENTQKTIFRTPSSNFTGVCSKYRGNPPPRKFTSIRSWLYPFLNVTWIWRGGIYRTEKHTFKLALSQSRTVLRQFWNCFETVLFQPKQNAPVVTDCDGQCVLFWMKQNCFKTVLKLFWNCFVSVSLRSSSLCGHFEIGRPYHTLEMVVIVCTVFIVTIRSFVNMAQANHTVK